MSFSDPWVETDPDGNSIFVSQLDDSDRVIKKGVRERMEGDPASPDLTGLIEIGSWSTAPKPRKGAARVYVDTQANILAFGATKCEDGRLAFASDSKRLYHAATAGVEEIGYISTATGGTIAAGGLTITAGGLVITAGGARVTAGNVSIGTAAPTSLYGLYVIGAMVSGGTSQVGIFSDATCSAEATNKHEAIVARANTPATAFTTTLTTGVTIKNAIKGTGSTINSNRGLMIEDQTAGTANYAIYTGLGTVRFGDDILAFSDDEPTAVLRRSQANGEILVLDQQQSLQSNIPYIAFQRAGTEKFNLAVGTDGQPTFNCKDNTTLACRDASAVIFFLADKGTGAGMAGLAVWDFTAGVNKRVTFGANDSGGAGFKLLRVAN